MAETERRRLAFVAPILPCRGGVAQYSTQLHRALRSRCDLLTVSFRRLYPPRLYPGRTWREPGREEHREEGVAYLLDSLRPATWGEAARRIEAFSSRGVVVTWWTAFWAPAFGYLARRLSARRIPVVFLCHNVLDHEARSWKRLLAASVLRRGDRYLVQSSAEADRLRALVPGAQPWIQTHPAFEHFPPPSSPLPRRAGLELLFFGFVRPYKGVRILAEAMELLRGEDVFLTIAGEWWSKEPRPSGDRLEILDRYISEEEVGALFQRADVVVLPYLSATGTGVAPLAYRFGKPVIATRVAGLADVVQDGVTGRLVEPDDPAALAAAVREFLAGGAVRPEAVREAASGMTWDALAGRVLELACP